MQLLISVAGPAEACAALRGGADVIDAKDPRRGALGPVSLQRLAAIRAAVAGARPLSAVAADTGAAGVLLDTATKRAPLFAVESPAGVAAWVAAAHAAGLFAALAGGLSGPDLARARSLGADVVGVRGAACVGGRTGRVSRARVAALRALAEAAPSLRVPIGRGVIPPSPSTSAASGRRAASACAYWSIPSTAIQCAASSPILTRLNIRRTASANGPPPGSTTRRRPRRNALKASITSSKAPAVPSNPPPTFTTV